MNSNVDPEPDDPADAGVEDERQDLVGRVRDRQEDDKDEPDFSLGGKLPPDHPDADVLDDLDLCGGDFGISRRSA